MINFPRWFGPYDLTAFTPTEGHQFPMSLNVLKCYFLRPHGHHSVLWTSHTLSVRLHTWPCARSDPGVGRREEWTSQEDGGRIYFFRVGGGCFSQWPKRGSVITVFFNFPGRVFSAPPKGLGGDSPCSPYAHLCGLPVCPPSSLPGPLFGQLNTELLAN